MPCWRSFPAIARPLEEIFDDVFARVCDEQRVPPGYRTEACRERMLADLRALVEDPDWTATSRDPRGTEIPI